MIFSILSIAAIYMASIVSSSPILSKRAFSNNKEWKNLDECLDFGLESSLEKSEGIEQEYSPFFKQLTDPKKVKQWKMPDGPLEFVELRCRSPANKEALDWYLGLTFPDWHINTESSVMDEIISSGSLREDIKISNPSEKMSPVGRKLQTVRRMMLERQILARKLLERFMNTPPSSFYPQSVFDKEALFRGPATNIRQRLSAPEFDANIDLATERRPDWQVALQMGPNYYELLDRRLAFYSTQVKELKLHGTKLGNEDKNKLSCFEDKAWLYTQKKKAYERLWFGNTRGGSVNHAKHQWRAAQKKQKTIETLNRLGEAKVRKDPGVERAIEQKFDPNRW